MTIQNIESVEQLLWTDMLHMLKLAQDTETGVDRSTYSRLTILLAVTLLESVCYRLLNLSDDKKSFREKIDGATQDNPVDWGKYPWQEISKLIQLRNNLTHNKTPLPRGTNNSNPDHLKSLLSINIDLIIQATKHIKQALTDICEKKGLEKPVWLELNEVKGFDSKSLFGIPTLTTSEANLDLNDPNVYHIRTLRDSQEVRYHSQLDPNYQQIIDEIKSQSQVVLDGIKVYRGDELVHDEKLNMR